MVRWFEGTDACVAPVLSLAEAPHNQHNRERGTFIEVGGIAQPAPAPRFSRTVPAPPEPPAATTIDVREALAAWGVDQGRIEALLTP